MAGVEVDDTIFFADVPSGSDTVSEEE